MRAIRQRTIFEQDRAKRSIVDHKEIVAALEARDTDRAERLVRRAHSACATMLTVTSISTDEKPWQSSVWTWGATHGG